VTLRQGIIAFAAVLLAADFALFLGVGAAPGLAGLGCWAVFILLALVFERSRYKQILDAPPGEGWTASSERFIDPASGRAVTVWEDRSGRRAYVATLPVHGEGGPSAER
jgi:hypothetical protein